MKIQNCAKCTILLTFSLILKVKILLNLFFAIILTNKMHNVIIGLTLNEEEKMLGTSKSLKKFMNCLEIRLF